MNKTLSLCCIAAAAFIIVYSCSNRPSHKEESTSQENKVEVPISRSQTLSDSSSRQSLSSQAAVEQNRDGMRFVRTADVKFKVANVAEATYHIEDVTNQYGGFVTYTDLHSTVSNTKIVPVSADSSLSITYYTVENDITLSVPNKRLDSTLRAISGLVDFLDHRTIVATDVSNQSLANELAGKRNKDYEQRILNQVDNKQMKQEEATAAQDKALQSREAADNARLANLSLDNQVKYSTVHLLIYQPQSTHKVKVCNDTNLSVYKPAFGTQLWEALMSGWEIFEELAVGLAHLWIFIILTVASIMAYRRYLRK